jgi:hypothetical protein
VIANNEEIKQEKQGSKKNPINLMLAVLCWGSKLGHLPLAHCLTSDLMSYSIYNVVSI